MRRRITLYIDGRLADIDDASFVVFNWRREDTDNPAVIRNSWSNSVTLPGTPDNDAIFSHAFRCDRRYNFTPDSFDPSARTPFAIYQETGEILVSGYCKLDSVARSGATHSYKVTLFGGLGSLLYSLAYDESGNKRTLASLDFLGGGASELDFPITAAKVQEAWGMLASGRVTAIAANTYTKSQLNTDGSITESLNNDRYVSEYPAEGGVVYYVSGRRFSYAGTSAIVAYDSASNVLATWQDGGSWSSFADYEITAPAGTAFIRVQGQAGVTDTGMYYIDPRWDIINFAPCYNGRPDGDFQADKALVRPADLGWPDSVTRDGKTYTTQGGAAVATLPDAMDEWQTKDLRAYLQRPVLSLIEFLRAIAKPENNGGWTLDISHIDGVVPWQSRRMWITLPMLPKEGASRSASVLSATRTASGWHTTTTTDEYTITGVQVGDNVRLRVSASPVLRIPTAASAGLSVLSSLGYSGHGHIENIVTFYQLIGYDGNGNKVAASKTLADYERPVEISQMVSLVGYTPDPLNTEYYEDHDSYVYQRVGATDDYKLALPIVLDITGAEMERVELVVKCYYEKDMAEHSGGTAPYIFLWKRYEGDVYYPTGLSFDDVVLSASAEGGALRSGMLVTKQMLLGGEHTPADYLTAIIKAFNLYLEVNDRDKTAVLHTCATYYLRSEQPLDFSDRIDTGEVELVPLNYDAKWYDFKLPLAEGAFGQEYRNTYGIPYGIQRVNTGYAFDAGAKDVFGGPALRSCVPVSKFAQQMCDAEDGASNYVPSPFVAPGGIYTLTAPDGSTLDVNITPGAPTAWLNAGSPGYDVPLSGRPEFCKADGGTIDGQDCLVWLVGWEDYPNFRLTDDDALMPTLAGGLCWLIAEPTQADLHIPTFSPIEVNASGETLWTLTFGQPRELALPGVTGNYAPSIYALQWGRLMGDRLNVDTKVVRVKADLSGLQVGPDLLRRFVWWDGCLWSINAITNYSLSTYDPAEVELVQVHDINNYI